jgi:hypothetical protein
MPAPESARRSGEEALWAATLRLRVAKYLVQQGISHGRIGDAPAWSVFPCVSVWAVESGVSPGWIGWWVICGDCPTDYTTCTGDRTPRSAVEDFSQRWRALSEAMRRGESFAGFSVGDPENSGELAPLLESRAELLASWALDGTLWEA